MSHTQIDAPAEERVPGLTGHALAVVGGAAVVMTAVTAALGYFSSSDQAADTQNLIGSLIFSVAFSLIALALILALGGRPVSTVAKGVITLAVLAAASLLLFWWSAGPFVLALAAFVLARRGGLLTRPSAYPAARVAGLFAGVVAALSIAFFVVVAISDLL
jgi:hypothetical protein